MSDKTREDRQTGRVIETEIEIAAPVEAVWKALTDARELARWFPLDAEVEPGPGGSIWLSWGELFEGRSTIEIWEPNRHLRTGWMQPDDDTRPVQTIVDYYLEGKAGTTRLRLVHSGFGREDTWYEEYDGTRRGWRFELRSLRHYLERHLGTPREVAWSMTQVEVPPEEAWNRLMSESGLLAEGSLSDASEGDSFRIETALGDELQGTVHVYDPPTDFSGTVRNVNDGLFRVGVEPGHGGGLHVVLWLATYGVKEATVQILQGHFESLLGALF